jgi:hypothetical protein
MMRSPSSDVGQEGYFGPLPCSERLRRSSRPCVQLDYFQNLRHFSSHAGCP